MTVVMVEGRRMMRRRRELSAHAFSQLLGEYRCLIVGVLEAEGGTALEAVADTAVAVFPTVTQAARAAVAVVAAVAAHEWPDEQQVEVSIGLHYSAAGGAWAGLAKDRCGELCDAAEGGQIFISQEAASLLEAQDIGHLQVRDAGEPTMRRTNRPVRAYQIVPR